jgi:hypothetical protein
MFFHIMDLFDFVWIFMQPWFAIYSTGMISPDQGSHILPCFARFAGKTGWTMRQLVEIKQSSGAL